jgi:hypothetical protein
MKIFKTIIIVLLLVMISLLCSMSRKLNVLYIEVRYKIEYQNSILQELEKEFGFFKRYMFDKKCWRK